MTGHLTPETCCLEKTDQRHEPGQRECTGQWQVIQGLHGPESCLGFLDRLEFVDETVYVLQRGRIGGAEISTRL